MRCIETAAPPAPNQTMSLAYDDAELLLSSILPDARIARIDSPSGSGRPDHVDIGIAVPRDTYDEALGVLLEAGYLRRADGPLDDRAQLLSAPDAGTLLTLHLFESDARRVPLQAA
jgi:hypothetical protein